MRRAPWLRAIVTPSRTRVTLIFAAPAGRPLKWKLPCPLEWRWTVVVLSFAARPGTAADGFGDVDADVGGGIVDLRAARIIHLDINVTPDVRDLELGRDQRGELRAVEVRLGDLSRRELGEVDRRATAVEARSAGVDREPEERDGLGGGIEGL